MVKKYIDMDGVLARFEQALNALERFEHEKGFFTTLEPTTFTIELQKRLNSGLEQADSLYILSASPNEQADCDKKAWLETHLPSLAKKVIFVRSGYEKAKFAQGNILIDDYTENLRFWSEHGGLPIKALNGLNGKTKRYQKLTASYVLVDEV